MKSYTNHFKDTAFAKAFAISFLMLIASLFINFYASSYATEKASNPVTDIILDHIPVFDVEGIFIWGSFVFVGCIVLACLSKPRRIPFALKTIALFVVIRAMFISLTHLAPFPTHAILDPVKFASYFIFGGDLFFSGHTGLPFLVALIFWDNRTLRISFIALAIIFGTVALMGHLHYSIDVFAAFFIAYAIYGMAEQMFWKARAIERAPSTSAK
ncbi:sphingomyelin synthase family protein [Candidatus Parcubacteria bacterium]|nr:sphingomyelin synthase family protein [Candidatus Parcubacteria bacterium]